MTSKITQISSRVIKMVTVAIPNVAVVAAAAVVVVGNNNNNNNNNDDDNNNIWRPIS